MNRTTRRAFLNAVSAAALPLVLPAGVSARQEPAANDRITMALIGCGGQGTGDMQGFMGRPEVRFVAVCDPVPEHRERARKMVDTKYGNTDCKVYSDFREVLARDDIDAVLIATPDHWHAIITIEACKAGKDVYCEKPESLTVREGRAMVEAVRRYGRVFSGGSQRVLGDYGDWPRLIRGGALGQIKEVYVDCGGPPIDCNLPAQPLPAGLDWEMWLGPAPYRPYNQQLIKGGFRPFREYSGNGMTDWGAHRFGAAMFAVGVHLEGPTDILPPDGKEVRLLTYRFANGLTMYHGGTNNIIYKGTEGELPGKHLPVSGQPKYQGYRGRGGIFGDFLHCVRTRETPFRAIEIAHRACTVCHLGNIAYLLNRPLRWDPVKEVILGDEEANRLLDRPRRGGWMLG